MLLVAQNWDKFVKELQKFIESRIAHIGKMCKNKWNGFGKKNKNNIGLL
jgi:hypothetical protein